MSTESSGILSAEWFAEYDRSISRSYGSASFAAHGFLSRRRGISEGYLDTYRVDIEDQMSSNDSQEKEFLEESQDKDQDWDLDQDEDQDEDEDWDWDWDHDHDQDHDQDRQKPLVAKLIKIKSERKLLRNGKSRVQKIIEEICTKQVNLCRVNICEMPA